MTLAGTRPPLISETNLYELHHRARLAIKPGITGMWQVSGRSDITDFEEVVRLDKEYLPDTDTTETEENTVDTSKNKTKKIVRTLFPKQWQNHFGDSSEDVLLLHMQNIISIRLAIQKFRNADSVAL